MAAGSSSGSGNLLDAFPCVPDEVRRQMLRNLSANGPLLSTSTFTQAPWAWGVCHAGSWIYRGHHYMWVVGRRHHHPPIHWIKQGDKLAFVPLHPHDVKGRPPVNRTGPVFAINTHGGPVVEKIELSMTHPIALLKDAPRELRGNSMPALAHAEAPRMEAHGMKDVTTAKGTMVRPAGVPITFNAKSQSFVMAHQEMHGGRSVTVNVPINNHSGNLQAGVGGRGGSGGMSGGHSGGSSGGSGGGSHGGGSSAGSSSAGSSGASSAGASSGGGSHH
jgi:hypothetical protein